MWTRTVDNACEKACVVGLLFLNKESINYVMRMARLPLTVVATR